MSRIQLLEDFNPLNTKPQAMASANPKIDTTPDLNDEEVVITWKSPSYLGEWMLSGPKRSKEDAQSIVRQMKSAETGSFPQVKHLLPIETFISTFAQKLNPMGWTLDFVPEDLDWTTTPGQHVNEAQASSKLPAMPKFLKDAGAVEEVSPQRGGPRKYGEERPKDCWLVEFDPLFSGIGGKKDKSQSIYFAPNGYFSFVLSGNKGFNNSFSGKWQASNSSQDEFRFGLFKMKGVKMQFTEFFGQNLPM